MSTPRFQVNTVSWQELLRTLVAILPVAVLLILPALLRGETDPFQALTVTLQPKVSEGSIPSWETGNISIQPESDALLLPVPALASQDEIGCFALTVVFQDNGDGGPVVEWQPTEGDTALLSAGLGETGVALGLNSRTLLLSQSLTLDGGTLRISFAGRFSRLISVVLRPARELGIASLGSDFKPALLAENEPVLSEEEVSGEDAAAQGGDQTEGNVVHAELSAATKQLALPGAGGILEFVVPMPSKPQGSLLQTEIGGIDPESWIEVNVNGESFGALGSAPFSLNSPGVLVSTTGRLLVAGWRPASLFLPARLWKQGDNSVVLTLHRVTGDAGTPVYLRKSRIDFLFTPTTTSSATTSPSASPAAPPLPASATLLPAVQANSPSALLSNGSVYGNPDPSLFHANVPVSLPGEKKPAQ